MEDKRKAKIISRIVSAASAVMTLAGFVGLYFSYMKEKEEREMRRISDLKVNTPNRERIKLRYPDEVS